ncbi:DUF5979 domain-containing protein [Corynebacterium urinipleomorphum]|uniref:DUF5979 domain-containing protein n=1 Tax=Corynebacterium urinipleomorphum TaxID=1852380 RepID=UPI0038B3D1CA
MTNNVAAGTTEIATANAENRELNCTVSWESKYQPATLELSKQLDGTAQNLSEMNDHKFIINHRCEDYQGCNKAYPGHLSGSRTFTRGQSASITGLPVGANCTVWESFQDGDKPVLPGKTLMLGWGSNGAATATAYTQGANGGGQARCSTRRTGSGSSTTRRNGQVPCSGVAVRAFGSV